MPLLPPPLRQPLLRPRALVLEPAAAAAWTCPSCLLLRPRISTARAQRPPPPLPFRHRPSRPFSSTRALSSDAALPNHYDTLSLSPTASPAEIKRQFYTLSKQHHPDRNPDDPNASTRFVAISEAYHVLSVPDKRAQYDAQLNQFKGTRWGRSRGGDHHGHPQGSYSSASSYAGSRPATGLNKKRGTFRGPPPSFYKAGGYGRHGAKRAEYAHANPHGARAERGHGQADAETEAGRESYGDFGGFGPGQAGQGSEVPHFDDRRHKAAHDNVNDYIQARRRQKLAREVEDDLDRGGTLFNFVLVMGAILAMGLSVKIFGDRAERKAKDRRD
ncbi:DnaJ-domain-containing protein [Corynespora cassiicola Philippines]|uniref:DnaJ-domain-containing protein n=1 Tax=Corynespora cassiicola Philippines TaxID=1448308 RepID=A0A2T2NTH2_CORCC|nr:DnaJ-domain-containing protein [Corynespora cassiicola Philippines]